MILPEHLEYDLGFSNIMWSEILKWWGPPSLTFALTFLVISNTFAIFDSFNPSGIKN